MALIDDIQSAIRVKTTLYNGELTDLISAAKLDLSMGGVVVADESDPLIKQAIKLYCKANFGYDENTEKFQQAYDNLKTSMALCGDYNEVEK